MKTDDYFYQIKKFLLTLLKRKNISQNLIVNRNFGKLKWNNRVLKYIGFSTPQRFYEWIIMPFRQKNASRIFQRRMNNVFEHLNSFLVVYVDVILISSKAIKEPREHLKTFVETAIKERICLSKTKATIEPKKLNCYNWN